MSNCIEIVDQAASGTWDEFVGKHPHGWICHLSKWKSFLEQNFPWMKANLLALMEGKSIVAGMPVYETGSWLTGKRMVSIPFATLSDPLAQRSDEFQQLMQGAIDLTARHKCSYLEVRTRATADLLLDSRFGANRCFKHHYLALELDLEDLRRTFDRTCIQQKITRAAKEKLKLARLQNSADFESYFRLYRQTRRRLGLLSLPLRVIRSLWETFSPTNNATILLAQYDGQTIAGLFLLKFRDRVSAEMLVSDERYWKFGSNHFLFWEAIKQAHAEGFKIFDFGRTSALDASLMNFKRRWGTKVQDLPIFYYPERYIHKFDPAHNSRTYNMARKTFKSLPSPILGALSAMIYRHFR